MNSRVIARWDACSPSVQVDTADDVHQVLGLLVTTLACRLGVLRLWRHYLLQAHARNDATFPTDLICTRWIDFKLDGALLILRLVC